MTLNKTGDRAPLWPTGHIGWSFSGLAEFEGWATWFLAEGAARGERLMFVCDSPRALAWPGELIGRGALVVASTSETYGADRIVDVAAQRGTFDAALAEALREGYSGVRVAADNTSLVTGPVRLAAWLLWEDEADRFMRENPLTGLCAFDQTRVDAASLSAVMDVHDVTADAAGP